MLQFKHFLLGAALLLASPVLAQTSPSPVPTGYTLKAPADYEQYAPQVLATINWLETSPLPSDSPQRKDANRFLMEWISGSPTVSVSMQPYLADLYGKNSDLLMAFLGGWARYSIQHPADKDQLTLNVEGIKGMLASYQTMGGKGNKKLTELASLNAKGQLPEWVKTRLK